MVELIKKAKELKASDLHLSYGLPPLVRSDGKISPIEGESPLDDAKLATLAHQFTKDVPESGEIDFAVTLADTRLRVNIFHSQGHLSVALRLLSDKIPVLDSLGLPPSVISLTELHRGIVLVTGETGSGKSTTLAAMLDDINKKRRVHILTLEDPIEYQYTPSLALINQREIGKDTESYANGLRAALREDPDVILIGEMRDRETIEIALTAAETGHLVFATLHTNSAADSIDRIVSVFPDGQQPQIRMQLSMTLSSVISQQLIPKKGGGRVLAYEVMMVNSAIRNLIREGKTPQIAGTIATSARDGSISMDQCLIKLVRERKTDIASAVAVAHDAEMVKRGAV